MLLLTATTDKLQLVTSGTAPIHVHASMIDLSDDDATMTPQRQNTAITTATTTDIVASPGATTTRNVKTLHVRNTHTSASNTVTLVFDQNGTDFELYKVTLRPGEQLEYVEGIGFFVLQSSVIVVEAKRKGSDQTHSLTTYADITDMSFDLDANSKYVIEYDLVHSHAATTTGIGFSVNGTGAVNALSIAVTTLCTRSAATVGAFASYGATAYDQPNIVTTATEAANVDYHSQMEVFVETGAAGITLAPRVRSEVAAAVTVKAASFVIMRKA